MKRYNKPKESMDHRNFTGRYNRPNSHQPAYYPGFLYTGGNSTQPKFGYNDLRYFGGHSLLPQNYSNWYIREKPQYNPNKYANNQRTIQPKEKTPPVEGSEEHTNRKIQETSAKIMQALLNPADVPHPMSSNSAGSASQIQAKATVKNSKVMKTNKKLNILSRKSKKQGASTQGSCKKDVNLKQREKTPQSPSHSKSTEMKNNITKPPSKSASTTNNLNTTAKGIQELILRHILNLNDGRKKNLINASESGYDVAIHQIQLQKRLEISRALRDMCSTKTQLSTDFINSIIPDAGIKIEDVPVEVIQEIRNTLGLDLDEYVPFGQTPEYTTSINVKQTFESQTASDADKIDFEITQTRPSESQDLTIVKPDKINFEIKKEVLDSTEWIEFGNTYTDGTIGVITSCRTVTDEDETEVKYSEILRAAETNNVGTDECEEVVVKAETVTITEDDIFDLDKIESSPISTNTDIKEFIDITESHLRISNSVSVQTLTAEVMDQSVETIRVNFDDKCVETIKPKSVNQLVQTPKVDCFDKFVSCDILKRAVTKPGTDTSTNTDPLCFTTFMDQLTSGDVNKLPSAEVVNQISLVDSYVQALTIWKTTLFDHLVTKHKLREPDKPPAGNPSLVTSPNVPKKKGKRKRNNHNSPEMKSKVFKKSPKLKVQKVSQSSGSSVELEDNSIMEQNETNSRVTERLESVPGLTVESAIPGKEDIPLLKFDNIAEKVLIVENIREYLLAATESGKIYFFYLKSGDCHRCITLSEFTIKCMFEQDGKLFVGVKQSCLKIYDFYSTKLLQALSIYDYIECMDYKWNCIFIGCYNGTLVRYSIQKKIIEFCSKLTECSIKTLKATKEGARKVILLGTVNNIVTIRDAMSGLHMRSITAVPSMVVYTMQITDNFVYFGSRDHGVLECSFHKGTMTHKFLPKKSINQIQKPISCVKIIKNLLFASSYDGNVYIYDILSKENKAILGGPGGVILSMEVLQNQIIVGTMSSKLVAIPIPRNLIQT